MQNSHELNAVSSADSQASVEIGDFSFCGVHGMERCDDCQVDFREDNAFTAGLDPVDEREALSVEYSLNKDGVPQCKKHKSTMCSNCFGFKKQIVKLNKDAEKAKKKAPKKSSNF